MTQLLKEKDIYTVLCKTLQLKDTDWGFNQDDFFFHCNNIMLDEVNANVYRSKLPKDDLSKRDLYNKLLRDLSFDLQIDTLQIKKSKLVYEEENLPDVNIAIQCRFMNKS